MTAHPSKSDPGPSRPPILLTPGPLTTAAETRAAMQRDWGSRDPSFIALTARVRQGLLDLLDGHDGFTAVPLQGSGTYAVEAMLGTFVPPRGKLLVGVNGAYGRRMMTIARRQGRQAVAVEGPDDQPLDPGRLAAALAADPSITQVAVVQCETTTGVLNPLPEIAEAVAAADGHRRLLVDAMSSLGALPVAATPAIDAVASSANKCLEGVPGVAFVLARSSALAAAEGSAPSLSLDLADQARGFAASGEWRFTPPTHVVAALATALDRHRAEGGVAGRGRRYRANCAALVAGMRALGFATYLPDETQAPIIVTFRLPGDPRFDFARFYAALATRGFLIYPGKLTAVPSFRIGCIGAIDEGDLRRAVAAVKASLAELGVESGAPAP